MTVLAALEPILPDDWPRTLFNQDSVWSTSNVVQVRTSQPIQMKTNWCTKLHIHQDQREFPDKLAKKMTEDGKNNLEIHSAKPKLEVKQMNQITKTKSRCLRGWPEPLWMYTPDDQKTEDPYECLPWWPEYRRPLWVFTLMTRMIKTPMSVYHDNLNDCDNHDDSLAMMTTEMTVLTRNQKLLLIFQIPVCLNVFNI